MKILLSAAASVALLGTAFAFDHHAGDDDMKAAKKELMAACKATVEANGDSMDCGCFVKKAFTDEAVMADVKAFQETGEMGDAGAAAAAACGSTAAE